LDHNLHLDPLPLNQARPGQSRHGGPTYLARDRGALNGSLRRVVLLLAGSDRVSLRLVERVPVLRGTARWCGSTRSTWRVHQGYTAGVRGLLCYAGCVPGHAGRAGGSGWVMLARPFPEEGNQTAGGASACGFGELYGPVRGCPQDRRRGGPGPRTYSGQRRRRGHLARSFPQVRGRVEVQVVAGCKTVGSAYVGSNPTPATTQHLPPPAKTARWLRKRGPAGRFLLVPRCVIVCRCRSSRSNRYGHIADSVRAKQAGRGTACFADPCPFCPVTRAPGLLV
jgi:hypothetical protein